jgi:DNA-binding HxlR family transcriptional regulator
MNAPTLDGCNCKRMMNKTYGQLCPIARSLDILGERWTLLVIRELLLGPKRFNELLAVLPAMGTNRLSERLKALTEYAVIRSTAPPGPAYELTASGEQLRKPLLGLGVWGLQLPTDERIDPRNMRAELIALSLAGVSNPATSAGLQASYEFHVGAEIFHIRVDDGDMVARSGSPDEPADIVLQCDMKTFLDLALRRTSPTAALRTGSAILLRGQRTTLTQAFRVLSYSPPKAVADKVAGFA